VVEHGFTPIDAFHFLSQGKPLGYSLGVGELHQLLVNRRRELTVPQVHAFFRRACMFSASNLTFEDIVRLLSPKNAKDYLGYARDLLGHASSLSTAALLNVSHSLPPLSASPRSSSPRATSPRALLSRPISPRLIGHTLPGDMGPVAARSLGRIDRSPLPSLRISDDPREYPRAIHYPRAYMLDAPAPLLSPRSMSAYRRPLSPITMSPRTMSYARALERPLLMGPHIQVPLEFMARQGQLDHHLEDIKALLPNSIPVEAVYGMLDTDHKGFVTDRDIWHFVQRFGCNLPFSSVFALIMELQNSRSHDPGFIKGQLSLREVGVLIHNKGTLDYQALDSSTTDQDARSQLYVMRSMGVRDPSDVIRNTSGTDPLFYTPLSADEQVLVYRIIETSARAADEMETMRKQLSFVHSTNFVDVFNAISGGKNFFTFVDLRRFLFEYKHWSSEHELQLIWHRYARKAEQVDFTAFKRQLDPLMGRS